MYIVVPIIDVDSPAATEAIIPLALFPSKAYALTVTQIVMPVTNGHSGLNNKLDNAVFI